MATYLAGGPISLVQALGRATAAPDLPKRTSHGMRAFFVRTAWSVGLDDTEIAIRLGHRSGTDLVQKTYGIAEPNWRGKGLQDWLPEPVADTAYKAWLGTPLGSNLGNSSPLLPVSNSKESTVFEEKVVRPEGIEPPTS